MRRRIDPRVRPMAARGQAPSPTMSVSLAAKPGSRERLNVRSRCGCSSCARQMRCTGPTEMPMALAIARPVQWVAWCGGTVHVNATAMAVAHRASRRGRPRVPSGQIVDRLVAPESGRGIGGNGRRVEQSQQRRGQGAANLPINLLAGAHARRRAGSAGGRSRPCSPNIPRCARSRPNRGCSPGCGPRSRLATGT
jgi:hypothetical protein